MSQNIDAHAPVDPSATRGRDRRGSTAALLVAALVIVVIVATAAVALTRTNSGAATITVTGSGSVMGTPDTVTVDLGVQTVSPSATGALDQNSARMRALMASLERSGIAKKDLQTSGLNLWENTDQAGHITGFTVSNTLTVTIHQLSKAGTALDAAAHAVGNDIQINGVTLSISNDSKLLAQARARAMRDAHTMASQVAAGGGAHVGSIVRIVDQENQNSYVYPVFGSVAAAGKALSSVPIAPGRQSVSVQVKVVYSL